MAHRLRKRGVVTEVKDGLSEEVCRLAPRKGPHGKNRSFIHECKHETHEAALPEIQKHIDRLGKLQYLLYADGNQSLLVVLEALDAAGKDGVIRHVFSGMIRKEHSSLVSKSQSGKRLPTTLSGVRTCARQAMVRL